MQIDFANGLSLQLLVDDGHFSGIGAVRCDGLDLRSSALPWLVYAESETGVRFEDWSFTAIEEAGEERTIIARARGRWMPRAQEADAMGDSRLRTRRLATGEATLRWTFRPLAEEIAGRSWRGLGMRIAIEAPGNPIHWLIEDTTWELGGSAAGSTLIQQDISTIDLEQEVTRSSAFSTIEKFALDGGWGGAFPMDMLPRCAGSSPLDFQAKGGDALILFSERPSLTRSRIDKHADEDLIHYTDRPFFALAESAVAPERKLLVHRRGAAMARHEARNLWLDAFQEVRARIHRTYGFTLETPRPTAWAHLWDGDLKRLGAGWTGPLMEAFPRYAALGYAQVITHGVWNSVTSDPQRRPDEGNICCPYDFTFAEAFGGNAGMRALVAAARAQGIDLHQWFSFHFSRYAPMWTEHPEWVLKEANGDPWDASYHTLWAGRMRSGYGEWMKKAICALREEVGLPGIFFDSYQNLGVTGVDWGAPDKAPQAEEIWRMQAELQRAGYVSQRPEIISIFGVSSVAMFGFANDKFRRRLWDDALQGDHAFALLDTAPSFFTQGSAFTADRCSPERYFWLAAHRSLPPISANPWTGEEPGGNLAERYAAVNRAYLRALPAMHRPELAAGGTHVVWRDVAGSPSAVWAIAGGAVEHTGPALEITGERRQRATGSLELAAGHVWLLGAHAERAAQAR